MRLTQRSQVHAATSWTTLPRYLIMSYSFDQLVSFVQSGGTRPNCRAVAAGRRNSTVPAALPLGLPIIVTSACHTLDLQIDDVRRLKQLRINLPARQIIFLLLEPDRGFWCPWFACDRVMEWPV
jgi:hypothetical protein